LSAGGGFGTTGLFGSQAPGVSSSGLFGTTTTQSGGLFGTGTSTFGQNTLGGGMNLMNIFFLYVNVFVADLSVVAEYEYLLALEWSWCVCSFIFSGFTSQQSTGLFGSSGQPSSNLFSTPGSTTSSAFGTKTPGSTGL